MIDVSVHGAEGRMGRLVGDLVSQSEGCRLAALVTEDGREQAAGEFHPTLPLTGQSAMATTVPAGGVIVDFSLAPALDGLLAGAAATDSALVIGTTGYDDAQLDAIAAHARRLPVVYASNFSIGIPALALLLGQLGRTLPADFQAEQVETHHRRKVDRPSGTARWLETIWNRARGVDSTPVHSQRIGGIFGEHRWTFSDEEETIEITHRAHSRRAFLRGVTPAVRFAAVASPGLYDLPAVLKHLAGAE